MRVLIFGDSITQGFHDEVAGGWCNRLVAEVMRRDVESGQQYDKSVFNLGISGDTSADLLKRIKYETESRKSKNLTYGGDVALIAIGVNDSQYHMQTLLTKLTLEETECNVHEIIQILQEQNLRVIFVGPAPVFESRIQPMAWKPTHGYSNPLIQKYSTLIQNISKKSECEFISTSDVYEGREKEVLLDGIHPSAEGHELIYNLVKASLEAKGIL